MRKLVIAPFLIALVCTAAAQEAEGPGAEQAALLAEVHQVLDETPVVDGHNDASWAIRSRVGGVLAGFDFRDTTTLERPMHTDITRLRAGGVGGQFWSVWIPPELSDDRMLRTTLEQIDLIQRLVERYPEDLELALTAADVERIYSEGRIACLIGIEGSYAIQDSIPVLRQTFRLGARYLTLTHWSTTGWADAATDEPEHGGLSPEGEAAVREMNRLGMLVDLSHVSAATMNDVLDVTRAPVIFSHSSAAALVDYPRNVPDEVLQRVRDNGGIVMVNFANFFLSDEVLQSYVGYKAEEARLEARYPGDPDRVEERLESWKDEHEPGPVPIGVAADHVDHIRDVAGIDHVGLGSDFDGIRSAPEGLDDVSGYPVLLAELLRRGYSHEDLAKVAGGNMLRVMRAVEQVAAELQAAEEPFEEDLRQPAE